MVGNKILTVRLVNSLLVLAVMCSAFAAGALANTTTPQSTETNMQAQQPIVPNICPQDKGDEIDVQRCAIKSEPICTAAPKTNLSVPCKNDTVTTPDVSSKKTIKTVVPEVTSSPAPDSAKQPITMDQALSIAFENSPSIKMALSGVEASRGSVDEARAQFHPNFQLFGSSTIQGPTVTTSMADGSTVTQVSSSDNLTGITFSLPLDISHKLKYSSDIAKFQFQIEYLSMVAASQQLIVDVKSAYYDLLRACGQMNVNQASVNDAQTRLDNIRAKYEEGAVPKYDVTSAEVELANLNQQLMASQNNVRIAQSSLNAILGIDVNNPTQVIAIDVTVSNEPVDIVAYVNKAYASRPEIKSAQLQVTSAQTNIKLQKTGVQPSLSISGGPSYDFDPSSNRDKESWSAGVSFSIPIWDGGVTKAKVRQAKAQVQNSVASLDLQKISVAKEVRSAALNLQSAALRTQSTAQAVMLAQDALDIAYDRYSSGVAILVEVTNAQSQLAQARYNYVNAQYDYAIALAQLQKATSCQPELNSLQLLASK